MYPWCESIVILEGNFQLLQSWILLCESYLFENIYQLSTAMCEATTNNLGMHQLKKVARSHETKPESISIQSRVGRLRSFSLQQKHCSITIGVFENIGDSMEERVNHSYVDFSLVPATVDESQCIRGDPLHALLSSQQTDLNSSESTVLLERNRIELAPPPYSDHSTSITFPEKLMDILSRGDETADILSWQSHGRSFKVRDNERILRFFRQTKYSSFTRQLNLWGYRRITHGEDAGSYYHEYFLRGRSHLLRRMRRTKSKGTGRKLRTNPSQEPDFYALERVRPLSPLNQANESGVLSLPSSLETSDSAIQQQTRNTGGHHATSSQVRNIQSIHSVSNVEQNGASYYDRQNFPDNILAETGREVSQEIGTIGVPVVNDRELDDYLSRLWELDASEASAPAANLESSNEGAGVASTRELPCDSNCHNTQSRRQQRRLTIASQFSVLETSDGNSLLREMLLPERHNNRTSD